MVRECAAPVSNTSATGMTCECVLFTGEQVRGAAQVPWSRVLESRKMFLNLSLVPQH
jgi:hypothetical protein